MKNTKFLKVLVLVLIIILVFMGQVYGAKNKTKKTPTKQTTQVQNAN